MQHKRLFLGLIVLILASLACSLFSRGDSELETSPPSAGESGPGEEGQPAAPPPSSSGKYDTEFPMPPKVENFMDLGDDAVNYQTPMNLVDVVAFYRNEFSQAGYSEREILTSVGDTTFSIVWDGHPSGTAIVVQGVDLGNGKVNVNVRFEDV
jgi:hypothetical protein